MKTTTKQHITRLFVILVALVSLIACVPNTPAPEDATPPPLAKVLHLHNWQDDIPQEILDAFTEETGVEIELTTYESQDEAITNLRNGNIYDVVILNNEWVAVAIAEERLTQLDFTILTNFRNISPNFRDLAYDPQNQHSVPYNWGTVGLVINPEKVDFPITSWSDLWDERLAGKIVIWNGQRTLLGVALKTLGYNANTTNLDELIQAEAKLMELRPNVIGFVSASTEVVPLLTTGDGAIALGYVGDIFAAQAEGFSFEYILPEEGTLLWGDNFVIPNNSPSIYTAHIFLNFLLRPESAASILEYNFYSTPNEGVAQLVTEEVRNDPLIFPPNEVLTEASLLLALPLEIENRYNEIWQLFVAGEAP